MTEKALAGGDGIGPSPKHGGELLGLRRRQAISHAFPSSISPLRSMVVVAFMAATAFACTDDRVGESVVLLRPFASTRAPLSMGATVALVSHQIACVVDSFESRIHCMDSRQRAVGVWGREGEGPGEFRGLPRVMRGPNGNLAAFDIRSARMTFFEPNGTLVSTTTLPADVLWTDYQAGRLLGYRFALIDRSRSEDQLDYVPMEAEASSGVVLWEREDLAAAIGRDCFNGRVGVLNPEGGFVTTACEHDMVFLDHRDADTATVVSAPNYFPAVPNARDVAAHVEGILRITGNRVSLSAARKESYAAEYREKPLQWFLGGPSALNFDGTHRLWAATTLDRDTFSYLEVWVDMKYAGTVRIRDRLLDYDIFGSTLVALVERKPDRYGVAQQALDWYDIADVDFTRN